MLGLIYAIINDGNIEPIIKANITKDYFEDEVGQYFEWIVHFYNKYKRVPSAEAFERQFKRHVEKTKDPVEYYVDKVKENFWANRVSKFLQQGVQRLQSVKDLDDLYKLLSFIAAEGSHITDEVVKESPVKHVEVGLQKYTQQDNQPVLKFPWITLNNHVGGLKKGEFWVISGRPGVGKTFLGIYILKSWFEMVDNKPLVLIISPEIDMITLVKRMLAIFYNVSLEWLNSKTKDAIEFVREKLQLWKELPMYIVDSISDVNQVELFVSYYKPVIVFVDSVYLLRDSYQYNKSALWENIASVLSKLRLAVVKYNLVLLVTTQLSRNVGEYSPIATLNDISYTDVFSQIADYIIGITGTQELRSQGLRSCKLLKARHSAPISWAINFKFKPQIDFSDVADVVSGSQSDQVIVNY